MEKYKKIKIILISVLFFGLVGFVLAQTETKTLPIPLPQSVIQAPSPASVLPVGPQSTKTEKIEIELINSTEIKKPIEVCKNLCGDGICQEIVCLAIGCPCPETPETCPQDCGLKSGKRVNLPNPAAVYCEKSGYKLEIRKDKEGNEYGVCVFPDGKECEEWDFFKEKCGREYKKIEPKEIEKELKEKTKILPVPVSPIIQLPSATKVEINPKVENPVSIEGKVLEIKGLEPKEMPKISVEVQTPGMKETTVQIEIDKEKKLINIEHENVVAQTVHQIKVEEKTLKIETPKGEISVNVLPSLATKVVIQKEPQKIEKVSLEVKNDIPVYETKGVKSEKFLGIIPVKIPIQSEISAQSGKIIKIQKPILMKALDFFSF